MTKQEAIEILNNKGFTFCNFERCVDFYSALNCEKCEEALDMAIKSLGQESIIRCEDCKHHGISNGPIEELSVQIQRQKGKSYLDEKFIVIREKEFETPHVNGIYDDLYSAIGHTISEITDYKKNCIRTIKELEYIKVGEMESLGSGGVYFRVESKVTSNEKAFTDYWKILFYKTESEE